jgi:hypothetical protein
MRRIHNEHNVPFVLLAGCCSIQCVRPDDDPIAKISLQVRTVIGGLKLMKLAQEFGIRMTDSHNITSASQLGNVGKGNRVLIALVIIIHLI